MHTFSGSIEIQMLLASTVLGIIHLAIATTLSNKDRGLPWGISMRDEGSPPVTRMTGRVLRAFDNFKETFVFFAVAVLVVALRSRENGTSALGAQLYFWARLIYIPVYAVGIPGLRTLVWTASVVGIVMVLGAMLA